MIYADNAATTKLDEEAFEAMKPFLLKSYGNVSQPYSFSRDAKKALADACQTIASCIGALPEEIFFTSGGTESDNWAIKGSLRYGDSRAIITSQIEHHAILNACRAVENLGYPVVYLPVDRNGIISAKTLNNYISNNTKLVSIMLANNEIGTIEPISELASIAHKNGALFHTDAVQAVGHIPIDVNDLGVDLLSASGHKFNAPKGVGFLYIKKGTPINAYADGGSQEYGMRAGTENVAGIVAMAVALSNNCKEINKTVEHSRKLANIFIETLRSKGVDFICNGSDNHLPNIINISIKVTNGEMLLHRLDLKEIYISTGSACDSINTQISHVIEAISVPNDYAKGTIRVSFGKDNTASEAKVIANSIFEIIECNESASKIN